MSKALNAAAYAIRHAAYVFNDEQDGPYLDNPEECARAAISAYLSALEEDGWKLVPVEASYDLEFARMADGTVKVGYNPRTEEGGWTLVGDVTKSVIAIEAQRDQALRDLDIANQRLSNVFAALAASPYAQKEDETND